MLHKLSDAEIHIYKTAKFKKRRLFNSIYVTIFVLILAIIQSKTGWDKWSMSEDPISWSEFINLIPGQPLNFG